MKIYDKGETVAFDNTGEFLDSFLQDHEYYPSSETRYKQGDIEYFIEKIRGIFEKDEEGNIVYKRSEK